MWLPCLARDAAKQAQRRFLRNLSKLRISIRGDGRRSRLVLRTVARDLARRRNEVVEPANATGELESGYAASSDFQRAKKEALNAAAVSPPAVSGPCSGGLGPS